MSQVPAGWYPDPEPTHPPGSLRRWDGVAWTGDVRLPDPSPPVAQTPDGVRLSGWWWRVLAVLLDGMVATIVAYVVTFPARQDVQQETTMLANDFQTRLLRGDEGAFGDYVNALLDLYYVDHLLTMLVVPALVAVTYQAAFLRYRGATPGKVVCGLQVRLREAPGRLPWSAIATRLAVQVGYYWVFIALVGLTRSWPVVVIAGLLVTVFSIVDPLWALGPRRQTVHDRAARTVVVRP